MDDELGTPDRGHGAPGDDDVPLVAIDAQDPSRVVAARRNSPLVVGIGEGENLPKIVFDQIAHFFTHYKDLEPEKWTRVGHWGDREDAKKVTKLVREQGPKTVKTQIQGEELRVSSKSRDDLQAAQALVKDADYDFAVQFTNYR